MKIKVINVRAEFLNAYADPIKQVINEAAGLNLKVADLRKSDAWKKIIKSDTDNFYSKLSNFLVEYNVVLKIICFDQDSIKANSDGVTKTSWQMQVHGEIYPIEPPEFSSDEFNGMTPYLLLSSREITEEDIKQTGENRDFTLFPANDANFAKMSNFHQRLRPLVEEYNKQVNEWSSALFDKKHQKIENDDKERKAQDNFWGAVIAGVILLVVVLGLSKCVSNISSSSSSSSSNSYKKDNSNCQPTLERCLANNPESNWYGCRDNYSACLSRNR